MANILLLISNDERDIEQQIDMSLLPHVIKVVYTVRDAFCQLYLFKPDLVLAEWFVTDGLALGALFLKRFRDVEDPKPQFVLMAGGPQPDQLGHFRQHAKKMGADAFIALPRNENDQGFAEAVERELAKKSQRRTWFSTGVPRLPARGMSVRFPVIQRRKTDVDAPLHARLASEVDTMATPLPDFTNAALDPVADACGGRATLMAILNRHAVVANPDLARSTYETLLAWSTPSAWQNLRAALAFQSKGSHNGPAEQALLAVARRIVYGVFASDDILFD